MTFWEWIKIGKDLTLGWQTLFFAAYGFGAWLYLIVKLLVKPW